MNQNQKTTKLNRCAFCSYWTGRSCMVTPNSYYCREANNEYYSYLKNNSKSQTTIKSFRKWDKK